STPPSHGGNTGSNPVGVTLGKENSPVQANRRILFIFINAQAGQGFLKSTYITFLAKPNPLAS
ncbi:hypothetical protein, partial [Rothia dentocariosa]